MAFFHKGSRVLSAQLQRFSLSVLIELDGCQTNLNFACDREGPVNKPGMPAQPIACTSLLHAYGSHTYVANNIHLPTCLRVLHAKNSMVSSSYFDMFRGQGFEKHDALCYTKNCLGTTKWKYHRHIYLDSS